MVRFQHVLLAVFVTAALWSCDLQPRPGASGMDNAFLDLDSLIGAQSNVLAGRNFMKMVRQGDQKEEKSLTFDTLAWAKELGVFKDININKSAYVGAYARVESPDGLNTRFTRKPKEKGGPVAVEVTRNERGVLTEIRGEVIKENVLYKARKTYVMTFSTTSGLLTSYEFSGHQKLAVKDEMTFRISGKL